MHKIILILFLLATTPISNLRCQAITTEYLRGFWRYVDSDSNFSSYNFIDSNTLITDMFWVHKNKIFNYRLEEINKKTYIKIYSKDSLDKFFLLIRKIRDNRIDVFPNDLPDSMQLNYHPGDSDSPYLYIGPVLIVGGKFEKFSQEITRKDLIGVWYFVKDNKVKNVAFKPSSIISEKHQSYSYSLDAPKTASVSEQWLSPKVS